MPGRVITTPRLRLEPFEERHLTARYVAWLNDPGIVRYSDQRFRRHTVESCRAYLQSFAGTPHRFWAIVAAGAGHIGNISAYHDEHHDVVDVGILIGESTHQGRGYATEAWLGACDHLMRIDGVRKVTAGTVVVNEPMVRLMRRTGMVDDGRRVRQNRWDGRDVDVVHAALFRDAWMARYPNGPFA